jgi:hypothetical protein
VDSIGIRIAFVRVDSSTVSHGRVHALNMELVFKADRKTMEGSDWFAMGRHNIDLVWQHVEGFLEEDLMKTIVLVEELVSGPFAPS